MAFVSLSPFGVVKQFHVSGPFCRSGAKGSDGWSRGANPVHITCKTEHHPCVDHTESAPADFLELRECAGTHFFLEWTGGLCKK